MECQSDGILSKNMYLDTLIKHSCDEIPYVQYHKFPALTMWEQGAVGREPGEVELCPGMKNESPAYKTVYMCVNQREASETVKLEGVEV